MRISGALNNIMMRCKMPEETNEQDCSEQNSRNQEKNNKGYEKEVKAVRLMTMEKMLASYQLAMK